VAAGVAGAALFMGFTLPEETPESGAGMSAVLPTADDFSGTHVPTASGVNDGMSFTEAFAAARGETGPGGVFFWKDGVYGTYYKDEWNQLSPEYKELFSNYSYQQPDDHMAGSVLPQDDPAVVPGSNGIDPEQGNITLNDDPDYPTAGSGDVEVLGVQYAAVDGDVEIYTGTDDDGVLLVEVGADNIFDASFPADDGIAANVYDTGAGADNIFDASLADDGIAVNVYDTGAGADDLFDASLADGGMDTYNMHDVSDVDFTHNVICEDLPPIETGDAYMVDSNMPDYTNDASVDNFTIMV
jgi:hypothetical protein